MRITIFIPSMLGGGAERTVANLSNYLSDYGNDVEILTFVDSECKYALNSKVVCTPLFNNYRSSFFRKVFFHFFQKGIIKQKLKRFQM